MLRPFFVSIFMYGSRVKKSENWRDLLKFAAVGSCHGGSTVEASNAC